MGKRSDTPGPESELSPRNRKAARAAARRYLRSACERCDSTVQLEAHHVDGNWRNNRADNVETLCASCHSAHHAAEFRAMPVETIVRGGRTVTLSRVRYTNTPLPPLPAKTAEELARAAAWGARRLLEVTIAAGSGGRYSMLRGGRFDWSAMKRRFTISVENNRKLEEAWRDACARLDLLSVYPHWYRLPREERPASQTAAQWHAEHRDRIEELLRKSRELEAASRPRKP